MAFRFVTSFISRDEAAILPFVALASPLFIMTLALVVDLDLGRLTANKLQISADAASLAGVTQLPVRADVESLAIEYSTKNYNTDNGNTRPVLTTDRIEIGFWDFNTRLFYAFDDGGGVYDRYWNSSAEVWVPTVSPAWATLNAVWVETRRDASNANPLPSVFGGIAGLDAYDISKVAIAVASGAPGGECIGGLPRDAM